GIAPFDDTLGDVVRRGLRSANRAQERRDNFGWRFSNVDAAALIGEARPDRTGGKVDLRFVIQQRRIAQRVDDAGSRLKPRREQRSALHAIALHRHHASKAAEGDSRRHRKCRQQRDRPQHGHQNHAAARIAAFHRTCLCGPGTLPCVEVATFRQATAASACPQAAGALARITKSASPSGLEPVVRSRRFNRTYWGNAPPAQFACQARAPSGAKRPNTNEMSNLPSIRTTGSFGVTSSKRARGPGQVARRLTKRLTSPSCSIIKLMRSSSSEPDAARPALTKTMPDGSPAKAAAAVLCSVLRGTKRAELKSPAKRSTASIRRSASVTLRVPRSKKSATLWISAVLAMMITEAIAS